MKRSRPWEIAADLESAAQAAREMIRCIDRIHASVFPEINAIVGLGDIDGLEDGLSALSDKYQDIADAEPDERAADELRTGFREEDFA